jgi:hypothetical protein
MSNTILTPTAVTRAALAILHQKLNFVGSINRQYDDQFAKDGAKIGSTLKIRMPNQYTVRTGATLAAQDTVESSQDLTVATQKGVDLNFTSTELTLSLQDFSDRVLEPAMSVLAANIEADAMNMYKDVYQSVWNSGSAFTYAKLLAGRVILQNGLAPMGKRTANVAPQPMADLVTDNKALFQNQEQISKAFLEGYVGRQAGFDFVENTLWPSFTRGTAASYTTDTRTSALATDGTAYATITTAGGTGTANPGDVFTIANCFTVHPETKVSLGVLQQFTVTAAQTATGSWGISPSIILGGAKQNVTMSATSATAALTFAASSGDVVDTSVAYHRDAFTFVTADLVMPKGVDFAARETLDGISMRIVRQYDINSDKFPARLDVLYGYKTLRPQWATVFHNN